jgi:thiol-disulfide isomerase/thioredoxin
VTEPLSLHGSLKGKIVLLDFFTYCCINCMHVLPDLKKLEQVYTIEDGLVVIGVHSAKFENEKDSANILSAVQRYDITHPVVNDCASSMWMNIKVQCWPTIVILGPKGNPIFVVMGEGHFDILERYVRNAIKFYQDKGELKSHSLPLNLATELVMSSNLNFPSKIVCSKYNEPSDDENELYAISDTSNHRILIINVVGDLLFKIGGKQSGFEDGDFKTAKFNAPAGLSFLDNDIIYVADTENHAIRKINLKTQQVETVVGNGKQGYDKVGGKLGQQQVISSPWDVVVYQTKDMDMSFHSDESVIPWKQVLLIAMAGTHQIWALFLEDTIWWKYKKYW